MADVEVKYKGSTIGSLSDTGTLTLETSGKYCEGDIGVYYVDPGGGGSGGNIYQDAEGYLVLDEEGAQGGITVVPLSVTENGTYTAAFGSAYSPVTVNVSGGGAAAESDAVRFIDYDGTILYAYSADDFLALSAMPTNPTHSGLTAQGWNWNLDEAQDYVQDWGYLDIGQQYITSSGDTEIDIEFPTDCKRLSPYLGLAINGSVTIDWGDNTSTNTVTGSSISTQVRTQHTYSSAGAYTISIHLNSGSFAFYSTNAYCLLSANDSSININRVYAAYIKAIRIGTNTINNTLGNYALNYCVNLQYITMPKKLDNVSAFTLSSTSPFNYTYSLKTLTIPRGATGLGGCSYSYSLKYVLMPNTITSLTTNPFSYCYALSSLILPKSLTSFSGTGILSENNARTIQRFIIPFQNYKEIHSNYDMGNILDGQTIMQANQFANIETMYDFTIPNNIVRTQSGVFAYCRKLRHITIPSGLTTMAQQPFIYCYSLEQLDVSHIDQLSNYLIQRCYALQSITLPSTITSNTKTVGSSCFDNCVNLSSISLPTNITGINASAFNNCQSLLSITVPSTVTTIGNYAFQNCYALSNITIPAAVTSIGNGVFANCYGMKEYHFKSTTPPTLGTTAFNNISSDCIIYVPSASLNTYKTATNWSTYASYMVGE